MKQTSIIIFLLLAVSIAVDAQERRLNRDPQYIVDPTAIMKILTPATEVEGTADMFEDWQQAAIYLSKGKQGTVLDVNYDIMNHIVAVRVKGKEYSLNPMAVDSMVFQDSDQALINSNVLQGLSGDALLLRLYQGTKFSLYRKTLVEIIKPTYNEALHVGSRNYKLDQDMTYLLRDKSTNVYHELKGKKKDFKDLANYDKISEFIKSQNIYLRKEADLIELVKYYEQLVN